MGFPHKLLRRICRRAYALLCGTLVVSAGSALPLSRPGEGVLEHGDVYQLMLVHRPFDKAARQAATFHDCVVDKTVAVADPADRRKLVAAIRSNLTRDRVPTGCMFMPRYGVHVAKGGHTLDLLICFRCFQCEAFDDGGGRLLGIDPAAKPALAGLIAP